MSRLINASGGAPSGLRRTTTVSGAVFGRSEAALPAGQSESFDSLPPGGSSVGPTDVTLIAPGTAKHWLMVADLGAALLGVVIATLIQRYWSPVTSSVLRTQWLLVVASLPFWLVAAAANNLYTARANSRSFDEFKNVVSTALLGVVAIVAIAFVFKVDDLSRSWVVALFLSSTVVIVAERQAARSVFRNLRMSGRLSRRVLVIGDDANATAVARSVAKRPDLGYKAVGFVSNPGSSSDMAGLPRLGSLADAVDIAEDAGATGAIISAASLSPEQVNQLTRRLVEAGIHVSLCSALVDIDISRLRIQDLDGQALIYVEPTIRTGWRRVAKRIFDVTIALLALIAAAPFMLVAAILIRWESKGPILFRQSRVGLNGVPFEIIKFRTMCVDADELKQGLLESNEMDGPMFKIRNDPRVTRVGRHLRKWSIDELPQFWNVIRGDMSVVGPRPALISEVAEWDPEVRDRLRVLPGITGMWQVSGRSCTSFEQYKRLDLRYVDNWSLAHDTRIVLRTILVVLRRDGAS